MVGAIRNSEIDSLGGSLVHPTMHAIDEPPSGNLIKVSVPEE